MIKIRKAIPNNYKIYDDYAELIIDSPKYGVFTFEIDLDDLEKVRKQHWCVHRTKNKKGGSINYYALCNSLEPKILLHRFLLDPSKKNSVDHADRNTFNNRKINLRECTIAENTRNSKKRINNTSGITGVFWYDYRGCQKWNAVIRVDKKLINLGYYDDVEDAIKARQDAEIKYFGEFKREDD